MEGPRTRLPACVPAPHTHQSRSCCCHHTNFEEMRTFGCLDDMISLSAKALSPMEGAEFPSVPLHGTVKMCLSKY